MIRPEKNPIYGINDTVGTRHFSKLRLTFSILNEHRFRHNFNCLNPVCMCGTAIDDNGHFLLHCPIYEEAERDLLGSLSNIPGLDIRKVNTQSLCHLLPYRNPRLTLIANRMASDPNCK